MRTPFLLRLVMVMLVCPPAAGLAAPLWGTYVDPMIGADGGGNVFVGPSMPFGMVKPGPDCHLNSNSGWSPLHEPVHGFSQVHVSGTGGGPKYGNVLIQPFLGPLAGTSHPQQRSRNWENLWWKDYTYDGFSGYIMPRDAQGRWFSQLTYGETVAHYTPDGAEPAEHVAWWERFFYEGTSEQYSLSVPHDVPRLIQLCGGEQRFVERLDMFFDRGYYDVTNEPSFLTPCLYHWARQPQLTSRRIRQIVERHFHATPAGLPGNDDSGAMSSWLAFHMMGLYPNAGQDYYLLHAPLVEHCVIHLKDQRQLTIEAYDGDVPMLNGQPIEGFWKLTHAQLTGGGHLLLPRIKP